MIAWIVPFFAEKRQGADVFHPRPWRYFSAFATRSRVAVWF